MSTPTKQGFIREYRKVIIEVYGTSWNVYVDKLSEFMLGDRRTISPATPWVFLNPSGLVRFAWEAIGRKDKFALHKLRKLPDENETTCAGSADVRQAHELCPLP